MFETSVFVLMLVVGSHAYTTDGKVMGIYGEPEGCNAAKLEMTLENTRLQRDLRIKPNQDQFRCSAWSVQHGAVVPFAGYEK